MKVDLNSILVKGLGKEVTTKVAKQAGADETLFLALLDYAENGTTTQAMKSSWIIGTLATFDPTFPTKYSDRVLAILKAATVGGVQREMLKTISRVKLKPEVHGSLIDLCFRMLHNHELDVAVKYYSIYIIEDALKVYPELKDELIASLEPQLELYNDSWRKYNKRRIEKLRKKYP
jgi:hypothetical protein